MTPGLLLHNQRVISYSMTTIIDPAGSLSTHPHTTEC